MGRSGRGGRDAALPTAPPAHRRAGQALCPAPVPGSAPQPLRGGRHFAGLCRRLAPWTRAGGPPPGNPCWGRFPSPFGVVGTSPDYAGA
jgi:hypothetical protein